MDKCLIRLKMKDSKFKFETVFLQDSTLFNSKSSFWVFILFQRKKKILTQVLSLIIFIMAWIGGGIRWFVSLRKMNVKGKKSNLRKFLLLLYIIPIFGIPCHFIYDLFESAILPLFHPKYIHTMRQPQYKIFWRKSLNQYWDKSLQSSNFMLFLR